MNFYTLDMNTKVIVDVDITNLNAAEIDTEHEYMTVSELIEEAAAAPDSERALQGLNNLLEKALQEITNSVFEMAKSGNFPNEVRENEEFKRVVPHFVEEGYNSAVEVTAIIRKAFNDYRQQIIQAISAAANNTVDTATLEKNTRGTGLLNNIFIQNTKLNNELGALLNAGATPLDVGKKGKKNIIINADIRLIDDSGNIIPNASYDEVDECIVNVICSYFIEREAAALTAEQIYRSYTGKSSREEVKKTQVEEVERRIEKLCSINAELDLENQIKAWNLPLTMCKRTGKILSIRSIYEMKHNSGHTMRVYEFNPPLLLDYAQAINQIYSVDRSIYRICETNPSGEAGSPLKRTKKSDVLILYIIKRVTAISRTDKLSATIDINRIYERYNAVEKAERHRARKIAEATLKDLKRKGVIADFIEKKARGAVTAYIIVRNPK